MKDNLRELKKEYNIQRGKMLMYYLKYLNELCKENERWYEYKLVNNIVTREWKEDISHDLIGTFDDIERIFQILQYEIEIEEYHMKRKKEDETK